MGWPLKKAMKTILEKRYVVDWADVYVKSVEEYISKLADTHAHSAE
jgi:hypothetical protein